ncbi:hypothetical protein CLD22_10445 [Rubrivivax gelatinosus]|nr:hypothetical protein [Rubrivivax gelatinosus]
MNTLQTLPARAEGRAHEAAPPALAGVRVTVVSHGFQPNYERGFVNGLASNRADVLLVGSDWTEHESLLPAVRMLNLRGSQDPRRGALHKAVNLLTYHARLMALVALRRDRVVHVAGLLRPVLFCGLVEGLWFRVFARRYVLTVHNLLPHDRHTWVNRLLHRLAYRVPQRLVVHTHAMKRQLAADYGVDPRHVVVMEHGIEPIDDTPLPALGRGDEPLRILFFGVLTGYKGLDLLLQALECEVPEFRLHVAGLCTDAQLKARTAQQIAAHPRASWIRWTEGFIDEAQVPGLFLDADVLVLPYRHIDQSGVLFQALRYGLPVIASRVGSFADYVGPDIGLVCTPGDCGSLRAAICSYVGRRERYSRERIRDRGRAFEWPRVSSVLARVYLTVPGGNQPGDPPL